MITAEPQRDLLDVVMPDRNGFQICRELKSSTSSAPSRDPVTSKDTASDRYWDSNRAPTLRHQTFYARRIAARSAQVRMIGHKNKVRATNR